MEEKETWEGWTVSTEYPGYRYHDVQDNKGRTHRVYRPIFTSPEQEAAVHEQVKRELTALMTDFYRKYGRLPGEPANSAVAG